MDLQQLQNFYVKHYEACLKYDPSYSRPGMPSLESVKKQVQSGETSFSWEGNLKAAHIGRLFDILEKVQTGELSRLAIARDILAITNARPTRPLDASFLEEVRRTEIALLSLLHSSPAPLPSLATPPPLPPSPPSSEVTEDEPQAPAAKPTWQEFMKKVKEVIGKSTKINVLSKFSSYLREKADNWSDEAIRVEYAVWLPTFEAAEKERPKEEKPKKKKKAEAEPEAAPTPLTPAVAPVPAPLPAPAPEPAAQEEKTKAKIPKKVKEDVWKTYVGEEIAKHKCLCCKMTTIDKAGFDCGHVVSEANGGGLEVKNLRPICAGCNHSMGTMNMVDYVKRHGYFIGGGM